MLCGFTRVHLDLLRLFELFLLPFLAHLLNIVMDRESCLCELNLIPLSIIARELTHIRSNLVLVFQHMPLQILHSRSQLIDSCASTTRFLLHELQILEIPLLLLVKHLLEIPVHVFSFMLFKLVLCVFDAPEASLHVLHHCVDVAHLFQYCLVFFSSGWSLIRFWTFILIYEFLLILFFIYRFSLI